MTPIDDLEGLLCKVQIVEQQSQTLFCDQHVPYKTCELERLDKDRSGGIGNLDGSDFPGKT
jgi:hypothetical protein